MTKSTRNRENITLMLVVVVSVFILCEIPDLVLRFMFTLMSFVKAIKFDIVQLRYFNTVTNALLTLNSAIDFLIYCLTQDVNKSGKNFQMRKIRFFSLLVHKNLIQYDEEW